MKGRLGHMMDYLKIMPKNRPFLASELPLLDREPKRRMTGAEFQRLEGCYLLRKVGKGGRQDRLWRWEVTDRAKRLLKEGA